ncbi:glycosyltransferase [Devosia sp. A449]
MDEIALQDPALTNLPAKSGALLLVTAVRLRQGPNGLQLDDQTCAGLARWTEHFSQVVFAGIALDTEREDATSTAWVDVNSLPCASQLRFLALPMAYRLGAFARTYRHTRQLLAKEISQADHLCFTIGYLVGDWAAVAAQEALAQKRKYGVWFDRVEHQVLRETVHAMPFKRQLKERATLLVMQHYHHYLTRRSSLALLQGMDTFNAYQQFSNNPACVYDVHTGPEDFASAADLAAKLTAIRAGAPLRVVYVGRAAEMKGPIDWLNVVAGAVKAGVPLHATWLGDGLLLSAMQAHIHHLGIEDHVTLAGHVDDRAKILDQLRRAHLFLFCHKTPESPRCLIEALVSACPIVGYDSAYASGLIEAGGGRLSPRHQVDQLTTMLIELAGNREALAQLVKQAATAGQGFEEGKLYAERAALIAAHT